MRQIIYSMQFKGNAQPVEGSTNILKAATTAESCTITSAAGTQGLSGSIQPAPGGKASFESEVKITGDSSFQESGTIRFGDGHALRFSTVGEGYLGNSPDPNWRHGSVIWRVDGGQGQFEGASGLITSNFLVGVAGEVVDNHFGVIWVK